MTKAVAVAMAVVAAGVGCGTGRGTLAGSAGAGGNGAPILGAGGAAPPLTGAAGFTGMGCGAIPRRVSLLPPDIVIVLDASVSMNDAVDGSCTDGCVNSKWSAAARAIDAVVTPTTAKANWGLTALPDFADACGGGRIAVPAGPFSAARIDQEISRRTNGEILLNGGNSPMRAAVDVAAAHLSARAPGGLRIVLVITDGEPDCAPGASDPFASDASGTVQAVTSAASLGISTTVIGVATAGGPAEATLAAMARAGDASASTYVRVANRDQLTAAMTDLVTGAADCTLAIPDPPTNDGTTSRSDISLESADQTSLIPGIRATQTDGTTRMARGWGAQLYGPACDALRAGKSVYVVFLCYVV